MKLQPEVVARLADRIARLFGDLEDSMIMQIALSLADGLPGSDDLTLKQINDWQIARLVAASQMRRQLIFKARQSLKPVPKALKGFFKEVEEEAKTLPDQAQKEAVGRWLGQEEVQPSLLLQQAMTEATDKLNLVATTMLTDAQQQHRDSLNRAADLMRQGQSPSVAIKEGVRDLVDKGLTGFYDKAGRKWEPQGGVNMMIRTTGNNMANEASFQAIEKTGTDVLLVSAHMGARPKCSLVQGKLFSLSGETTSIKDGNGQTLAVGDWNKTSYGEPDGILGINCRHHIVPFYEGKSINNEEEIDVSENAHRYKLEQKQRRKERELRKTKRQRDVAKAIGDEKGYKEAQQKARRQSKDLREFIEDNGLRRSKVRERNSYVPADNKETPARKLNRSEDTTGKIKGMAGEGNKGGYEIDSGEKRQSDNEEYFSSKSVSDRDKLVRQEYLRKLDGIDAKIDKSLPKEEQAKQAFDLRNQIKKEQRDAMQDQALRRALDQDKPIPTWDDFLKDKMQRKHLSRDEAIDDILKTAGKSNASANKAAGINRKED